MGNYMYSKSFANAVQGGHEEADGFELSRSFRTLSAKRSSCVTGPERRPSGFFASVARSPSLCFCEASSAKHWMDGKDEIVSTK